MHQKADESDCYWLCYSQHPGCLPKVTVTGNVRNERDEGAIGATVLLVGSQKGAITDSEGNFKLSVPNAQTAVLQISYVGYRDSRRSPSKEKPESESS